MNSLELQELFPDVYETFHQEHEYVFSLPFACNRAWDMLPNYSWISIRQKLPLRLYVWIGIGSKATELNTITRYNHLSNEFVSRKAHQHGNYFQKVQQALPPEFKNKHYSISILSECSMSLGLWFTSIFSLAVLTSIYYIEWLLSQEDLQCLKHWSINNIINNNSNIRMLISESMEIDKITLEKASFTTKVASLFHWFYPIMGMKQDNGSGYTTLQYDKWYYAYRLNDFYSGLQEHYSFPLDLDIIYTGKPFTIDAIYHYPERSHFKKAKIKLKDRFSADFASLSPVYKPKFYKHLLEQYTSDVSEVYGKMLWSISIEILSLFWEIFSHSYEESSLLDFIHVLNKFQTTSTLTRINSSDYVTFIWTWNKFFADQQQHHALFSNDTTISGWCVSIISTTESLQKRIHQFINTQQNEWTNITHIYSNQKDGYSEDGFTVEQDIPKNIRSKYLHWNLYKFYSRDKKYQLKTYESIINCKDHNIIVDMTKNKIYVDNKACTSDDMFSQSATCELLHHLIDGDHVTHSKQLSPSSYTKNKHEILTKVVKPLLNTISTKLWKNISIECDGHMWNYTIKANFNNIKVGLLYSI